MQSDPIEILKQCVKEMFPGFELDKESFDRMEQILNREVNGGLMDKVVDLKTVRDLKAGKVPLKSLEEPEEFDPYALLSPEFYHKQWDGVEPHPSDGNGSVTLLGLLWAAAVAGDLAEDLEAVQYFSKLITVMVSNRVPVVPLKHIKKQYLGYIITKDPTDIEAARQALMDDPIIE